MTDQEARDELALLIARTMDGWNDDTTEPGMGDPLMRRMAEEHWERVNAECLRQGGEYADAILAAGYRKHPEPEVTDHVQRFAEGAAAQFRSDLDYDGAEIKRRILMDAHLTAADHPGEGEPCAVCEHDDRLDYTGSEDQL